ncbi:hypothetical protein AVI51_09625 [Piscirickettsia salmonis]|uniref:Uncharacterized protein n=4 Tax=Piscirickettsia salmonis TaxID=1238 RepID=A0A9Q5V6Y7_PISSA|nr:hypothetical protein [Piscirickettsia salmonis]ERL61103.1 hypothetical protein K661_02568 [Piscirickettsia salmonis LF-89 = ATCC VR-1361]WGZ72199.1 hypothetical protein E3220_11725 [Piscirickettsia salmonis EM-90]ALA23672.1 hypothetical protein KW89_203 [Piscirickettsia salmonis]APS51093.1 hypothetical protein AVI50_09720 [Piscirickettsia salmonis]APS54301.1 hypothetical protein AVI51_09625 [Piscirickettsia salmonis]
MKIYIFLMILIIPYIASAMPLENTKVNMKVMVTIIPPLKLKVGNLNFDTLVKPITGKKMYQADTELYLYGAPKQSVKITLAKQVTIENKKNKLIVWLSLVNKKVILNRKGKAYSVITGAIKLTPLTKTGNYSGQTIITASYF